MKKILLCSALIVVTGCASLPPAANSFRQSLAHGNYDKAVEAVPYLDLETIYDDGTRDKPRALQLAAIWGNEDVVLALIRHGADVNYKTNIGNSALREATRNGNSEIVKVLLANGAIPRENFVKSIFKDRDGLNIAKHYQAAGYDIPLDKQKKLSGNSDDNFQWGKALALSVGAVAGGGLKLDTDTQAGVIAGIVLDSQANTSGTSNLNNAVETSLETNAQRAAASTSLPSSSKSAATTATNPTAQNSNPSDTVGNTQTAGSASGANTKLAEASSQTAGAKSLYTQSYSFCVAEGVKGSAAERDFEILFIRTEPTPKLIPISDINVFSDLNSAHKIKAERVLRNKIESYLREKGWKITSTHCTTGLAIPWEYEDAKPRLDKAIAGDKRFDADRVELIHVDVD